MEQVDSIFFGDPKTAAMKSWEGHRNGDRDRAAIDVARAQPAATSRATNRRGADPMLEMTSAGACGASYIFSQDGCMA